MAKRKNDVNVEEENVLEIEYQKASFARRVLSALLDMILFGVFTFLLYSYALSFLPLTFPSYVANVETFTERKAESGLFSDFYEQDDSTLVSDYYRHEIAQAENSDRKLEVTEEANTYIEQVLTDFYQMETFLEVTGGLKTYREQKIPEGEQISFYFVYSETGQIVPNGARSQDEMWEFYQSAVDEALNYLYQDSVLLSSSRVITWTHVGMISIAIIIGGCLFYLMFPFIFKKNRQTLGKKLFKLGVINADGLRPNNKKTLGRFALFFFLEIVLSLLTFGVPLIISFSMVAFSKTGTSLHDYLANTYVVDVSTYNIYKSIDEYQGEEKHKRNFDVKPRDVFYRK